LSPCPVPGTVLGAEEIWLWVKQERQGTTGTPFTSNMTWIVTQALEWWLWMEPEGPSI
jgi:hypothetical protein